MEFNLNTIKALFILNLSDEKSEKYFIAFALRVECLGKTKPT